MKPAAIRWMCLSLLVFAFLPIETQAQSELFFSEYVEGSSNNKALEIFNGTGSAVDLAAGQYQVEMYFNGSTSVGLTISLTGTVADDDVYVLAHASAEASILAVADQTNSSSWYNGDDALVLRKGGSGGTIVDVIGQIGVDPGVEWGTGLTSTMDNTLRRKPEILAGDTDPNDAFDPSVEWDGFASNTFDGLGAHTVTPPLATQMIINELDSDTPGTDMLEFVELYDGGSGNTVLDGLVVVFYNGSNDLSYASFDLDGFSTDADGFFLLGNTGVSPAPSVSFADNFLQNGADAVAVYVGNATDFPNNTAVTATNLLDAIVYETSDPDDAGLLVLLNSGQPQVDENSGGDSANESNSRVPDGGTQRNTNTYVQQAPTPGATNVPPVVATNMIINELDADTPGSLDMLEFVELYDGGSGNTVLDGLVLVLFDGAADASYAAFDLDGLSTNASGFFLIGNSGVSPSPGLAFADDLLQNGADAAAIYAGNAVDFPNGTPVSTSNLVDAVVYGTDDADDAGLLVLLNAGQPQVNENGAGDAENDSNSRVPDGGTQRNTDPFVQQNPTPGATNILPPSSPIVINEIDSDTPGATDLLEFIELYDGGIGNTALDGLVVVLYNGNNDLSYAAFDLDGFTTDADGFFLLGNTGVTPAPSITFGNGVLQNGADAVAVYVGNASDFPSGTAITTVNLIDAVVYGTDDPDDAALLILLNAGQPQINENGGGDKDNQSNSRVPDGGTQRNTNTYAQQAPTPARSNVESPVVTAEIWEIQGMGLSSPLATQTVTTEDNVVTALRSDGFFIQTPTARSDGDPQTSDGIFVFTSSAPAVNVGDLVDVTGPVSEFFDFTEFNNGPTVVVSSSGNALPAPVPLDALTPSPNQPQSATELERFEGMLVEIAAGVIAGPNQEFGTDPIAEMHVVASSNRPFREPGIEFPGLSGLPLWDGNPEIFEFDPDRLGQPNAAMPAGSTFSATGILAFEFGGYELWPAQYSFTAVTIPRPVRARAINELTIATLNMLRFFDDVNDGIGEPVPTPAEYQNTLAKFSKYIREVLLAPDVLAVQEAENLNALQDLANQMASDDAGLIYTPYLLEGNDVGGIDVGFLVRGGVQVNSVTQLGAGEIFTFDGSLLHDRPPLLIDATLPGGMPVSVMNLHLRSLNDIEDPANGPRVRQKRQDQATSVSLMVQSLQTSNPNINLVVLGDFNAFQFTDGYVHVLGQVTGNPADNAQALIAGTDEVNPDLIDLVNTMPAAEQYSYNFEGSAQVLDHVLVSQTLNQIVSGIQYARGNSDAAENYHGDPSTTLRTSDHDGLVLYVKCTLAADAGEDKEICQGNSVQIGGDPTASEGTAPYSYSWTPLDGLDSPTASNPTASPIATTTYAVEVTDATNCKATDQMTVTVNPFPVADAGADQEFCSGDTITLGGNPTGTGGTGSLSFIWRPAIGLDDSTVANPKLSLTATTTTVSAYVVIVTDVHGCMDTDTVQVTVNPNPVVDAGADIEACIGEPVTLHATVTGGTPPFIYLWSPSDGLDDPNSANPVAILASNMAYSVEITDSKGCHGMDEVAVAVRQLVFLADNLVKINRNVQSDGDIHCNNKIEFGKGNPGVYTGNVTGGGDVTIRDKNTIVGDVVAGEDLYLFGSAAVTGTKDEHASVAFIPMPSISFTAGGQDTTVPKNVVLALPPGSYRRVLVKDRGTLRLSSGSYYFDVLHAEKLANLIIDVSAGRANINVVSDLVLDTKVAIEIVGTNASTEKVSLITLQDPKVDIGKGALIQGVLIAQNAEVHFSSGCQFKGSICAESITLDPKVPFSFHSGNVLTKPAGWDEEEFEGEQNAAESVVVTQFALAQNYPNPFNPSTTLSFDLLEAGEVVVQIFNESGQHVRTLVNREMPRGRHNVRWNGRNQSGNCVAAGVYLYRITVKGREGNVVFNATKRMTMIK